MTWPTVGMGIQNNKSEKEKYVLNLKKDLRLKKQKAKQHFSFQSAFNQSLMME